MSIRGRLRVKETSEDKIHRILNRCHFILREYSLTGIFMAGYIYINRKMTIVMKEMRLYREPSLNEVNDMSGKIPGMDMTTLSALSEPNRKAIVELLRDGPLTVGEIADRLGLRQPQASKHLKVLSDNGILEVKAEANRRIYKLRPEPFQALDSWVKSFRRVMEARFDNLEDYLRELQIKEKP
jgi:DNA-binding transcriptional ArsR family regulator